MAKVRPARKIRPYVRDYLDRLESEITQLRGENVELRRLITEIATQGAVEPPADDRRVSLPALVQLPPGWGMRLGVFLERAGMPERTFYRLREQGKVRSVLLGDRAVYVLIDTYIALLCGADERQNVPGAPQHLAPNPPPRRCEAARAANLKHQTGASTTGPPP
jgi:hypothetical protein